MYFFLSCFLCLTLLVFLHRHGHKNTILAVNWNANGNWLLTSSRDQLLKLFDLRTMKELQTFRGHKREVTVASWHPIHEDFFASASYDGSIMYWRVGYELRE